MATKPISLRLDDGLLSALTEGSRRTSLNKTDLIRRTLRLHLPDVIRREAKSEEPLTSVSPWSDGTLRKAYARIGEEWDQIEAAAAAAQRTPRFED